MVARVLLGIIAALRAVLIPGQAELLMTRPLSWPRASLPPANVPSALPAGPMDHGDIAVEVSAA